MDKVAFYKYKDYIFKILYNERAITYLNVVNNMGKGGEKSTLSDKVFKQIIEYFEGKRKVFDFPYELKGTDFQIKVWNALRAIPYGETRSYKDIAIAIGSPKSCRAVGGANNKNPILIAIPCHRVIGASGKLVGFAGGIEMKEALLTLEKE